MEHISKAIIPVAGLGTRFLPITRVISKELVPLVDKPVIQYIVEECTVAGIREIIFVVNKNNGRQLKNYFDISHARHMFGIAAPFIKKEVEQLADLIKKTTFHYVEQKNLSGDGDAILCARRFIHPGEPFALSMGDLIVDANPPALREMVTLYHHHKVPIIAVEKVSRKLISHYGVIKKGRLINSRLWQVADIIEKPERERAPSLLAMVGKYILTSEIFHYIQSESAKKRGEIKLAHALTRFANDQKLLAYQIAGSHFDCGDKLGFLKATVHFGARHAYLGKDFQNFLRLTCD